MMTYIHNISFRLLIFVLVAMMLLVPFFGLAMAPLFFLAALGPLVLFIRERRYLRLCEGSSTRLGLIIISLALLSSLWSIVPEKTFSYALQLVSLYFASVALYFYFSTLSQKEVDTIGGCAFPAFCIGALLWSVDVFFGGLFTQFLRLLTGDNDYVYTLNDLNRGATFLVLMFWSLALLLAGRYRPFIVLFPAVVLMVLLSFSASLAAILAMCCAIMFFVWSNLFPRLRFLSGSLISVVAVVGILSLAFGFGYKLYDYVPDTAKHRLIIWDFVAEKALEKPIEGVGYHNARYVEKSDADMVNGFDPLPVHPHNIVLQIWLELGLMGVVCFFAVLWQLLRFFESVPVAVNVAQKAAFCSWYIAFLVIASVAYEVWQPWWVATVVMTFLLGNLFLKQYDFNERVY